MNNITTMEEIPEMLDEKELRRRAMIKICILLVIVFAIMMCMWALTGFYPCKNWDCYTYLKNRTLLADEDKT